MNSLTYDDVKRDIKDYCAKNKISVSEFSRRADIECHTVLTFIRKNNRIILLHLFKIAKILRYTDEQVTIIYLGDSNLTGKVFGHWTVLRPVTLNESINNGQQLKYICKCVCGKQKEVNAKSLLQGLSISCGCRRAENQTVNQVKGKLRGQQIIDKLHDEHLSASYCKVEANKNSQSGIRGVSPYHGQWRATITAAGKWYNLGIFDDLQKAIAVRKQAEEELHGPLLKQAKKIKSEVLKKPLD